MPTRYYFGQESNVYPLVTREVRRNPVLEPLKEYHALIAGCTEVAGVAVKDKKLKLQPQQAQYWLDQGVIGEAAGEHHAGAALGKKK